MYDDKAFCEFIKSRGYKLSAVAKAMGMAASTLYRKRRGSLEFTLGEIQKFCIFCGEERMSTEICAIFFADKVA